MEGDENGSHYKVVLIAKVVSRQEENEDGICKIRQA